MTCPTGATAATVSFGHDVTATTPYSVVIEYGDGKRYSGDDAHLPGVFSHTYSQSGSFSVTAHLVDAAGQTADAACSLSWVRPAAAAEAERSASGSTGSGSSGRAGTADSSGSSGSSGSSDDYYTNSDGDEVHRPEVADSAPADASAECRDGSYSFSQHRSGTCSHHGGVASWL